MPGPVVNGVRHSASLAETETTSSSKDDFLPLMAEGSIRLLLLTSGDLVMARLRNTTDRDGDPAYQLIRPRRVAFIDHTGDQQTPQWTLEPYLAGLTTQRNIARVRCRAS